MALERLQKIIAAAGLASRRHAEELISRGKVRVNGAAVRELGTRADPARDTIEVNGEVIPRREEMAYFMLNKPIRTVCTVSDPEGRPTVMKSFDHLKLRLYPVGRLDWDSEGLLIVTNDGELAHRLTHPSTGIEKTYEVKVRGVVHEGLTRKLAGGVSLDDGEQSPACRVEVMTGTDKSTWLRIRLSSGQNRIIRRMCEAVGLEVQRLRRVGIGSLDLGRLPPGQYRPLKPKEIKRLFAMGPGDSWRGEGDGVIIRQTRKSLGRKGQTRAAVPRQPEDAGARRGADKTQPESAAAGRQSFKDAGRAPRTAEGRKSGRPEGRKLSAAEYFSSRGPARPSRAAAAGPSGNAKRPPGARPGKPSAAVREPARRSTTERGGKPEPNAGKAVRAAHPSRGRGGKPGTDRAPSRPGRRAAFAAGKRGKPSR
ncbi:MAG: hypothetical protein GMKNLPBB_00408 [Myxococcota bacterium]|nr:hypothetical protein [Myxococcota bacterium]